MLLRKHKLTIIPDGYSEPRIIVLLFSIYIVLSFFEVYLYRFIGGSTKYFLLLMIALWIYIQGFRIRVHILSEFCFFWLCFKFLSLLWSSMQNNDVRLHLISQIGMVLLVLASTSSVRSKSFLTGMIRLSYICSFAFGVLSVVFREAYIDERFVARQVLTLWGAQNDPNNCSAFLAIGIGLALYSLFCEKEKKILNILVILVNTYATILTGSRGGFALLLVLAVTSVFFPNWNRKIIFIDVLKRMVIFTVVLVISVYVIDRFIPAASLARIVAFDEYQGFSGRSTKWEIAINLIKQRPLFGWGWGGYTITGISVVHNTYLTVLCDTGIVGFILFFVPVIYTIIKSIKYRSMLSFAVLIMGLVPAFSIDSINKRFFWNAIILSYMIIDYIKENHSHICLWDDGVLAE